MKNFLKTILLVSFGVVLAFLTISVELGYLDMNSIYVSGAITVFHLGFMIYFFINVIREIDIFESLIGIVLFGLSLIYYILKY